jgi:hypothetical protein
MFYISLLSNKKSRISLACLVLVVASIACSSEEDANDFSPKIIEVDKQSLVVGETLYLYGKNFSDFEYQTNKIFFEGVYTDDFNQQTEVSFGLIPIYDGEVEVNGQTLQRLRVNRFGPFKNPFLNAARPGTFKGNIVGAIEDDNGDIFADLEPKSFALTVEPSIHITEFQPIFADCGEPALRAIQGLAYRLSVQISGIQATRIEYQFSHINDSENLTTYEHSYATPVNEDSIGDAEPIFFNLVKDGEQFFVTSLRVLAYDTEGNVIETALPITVHRPLEVVYNGKRDIAQRYDPIPVSGCTPGSIGTRVNYSETKSEARQRTVSVTVNQSWIRNRGQSLSRSWREGVSEGQSQSRTLGSSNSEEEYLSESMNLSYNKSNANSIDFSESDGENWQWNMSEGEGNTTYEEQMSALYGSGSWSATIGAKTEVSIPLIAKSTGSVSTTAGTKIGGRTSGTTGESTTTSSERGYSTSGSNNESRNFGSSSTESRGQNIDNSYALASVTESSIDESKGISNTRTWNLSESEVTSEVISENESVAETLTISDSNSDATTQAFTGFIPRGRYGIFYRQTTRWVRRAEVRSYNQCGIAQHVGELQFNEYTWAPDLAIATDCDEQVPAPNLPRAACLIPPCGG